MERYRTVKQHDVVSCPECGAELVVVSSAIPENKSYQCSQCGAVIGSTRGRLKMGQVRVSSEDLADEPLRLR